MLGFSRQIAGPEAGEVLAKRSGGRGIARQIQQGDGHFRGTISVSYTHLDVYKRQLEGDAIKDFAERLLEEPVEVSANPSTRERKKIHQWYYRCV